MDPFASIDDEVGQPSDSQEERLLHSNFINDSPDPHSLPTADAAVVIRYPADSPSAVAGHDAGLELPKVDAKGKSPAIPGEAYLGGREIPGPSKRCKIKSCASRRRLRGVQIRSSASPDGTPSDGDGELGFGDGGVPLSRPDQEDGMRSENPEFDPNAQTSTTMTPDFTAEVVPGSRKLPASIRNPPPAEGNDGSSSSAAGGRNSPTSIPRAAVSVGEKPVFPGSLLDVIKMFSEKPSRRFADTDILEILDMKNAAFLPPQWWRPEGYGN